MHKTFTDSTNSYWQNGKINRRHDDLWQNAKFHCHLHETHTRNGDYDQITLEVSTANQRNNICPIWTLSLLVTV